MSEAETARHDVLVFGGGPAGTAAAMRLARLGMDVGLIEPAQFPRRHVGICIAQPTVDLLDFLDVGDRFRALRSLPREYTAIRWGTSGARLVEQRGYHVDRGALDHLLLQRAAAEGVRIYQPARATRAPENHDSGYDCSVSVAGSSQRISCDFLVDAAGRRPALPGARAKDSPPLIALYADWRLNSPPSFDGLIESGTDAWVWFARTRKDRATVSVFLDPREAQFGKRDLRARYHSLLTEFPSLSEFLNGNLSELRACDATSSHALDVIGARHIRIGDACMSVDPLSSQGVHLALQSGIQCAIIVHTILGRPSHAGIARQFYRDRVSERIARFSAGARTEYARVAALSQHPFWQERSNGHTTPAIGSAKLRSEALPSDPGLRIALAADADIARGPIVVGDFVELGDILRHPDFAQPVAYLAGVNLHPLLQQLPLAIRDIPHLWGDQVGETRAWEIARWLWQRRILVEAS